MSAPVNTAGITDRASASHGFGAFALNQNSATTASPTARAVLHANGLVRLPLKSDESSGLLTVPRISRSKSPATFWRATAAFSRSATRPSVPMSVTAPTSIAIARRRSSMSSDQRSSSTVRGFPSSCLIALSIWCMSVVFPMPHSPEMEMA